MAALTIVADATHATVDGSAASIRLVISGWSGRSNPVVRLSFGGRSAERWVSVQMQRSAGARRSVVVVFDPSAGPKPRAGDYLVQVSVERGGQQASTAVHFVVPRHPCLTFGPRPSWTWDPSSSSVTVTLQLWNCGNVDLNLTWSARLEGRRLRVDAPAIEVPVDGGWVDATVTIELPRGRAELEVAPDLEAVSDANERWNVDPPRRRRPPPIRRERRLTAPLVVGLLAIIAGGIAFIVLRDDPDPVVAADTTVPASDAPATEAPAPTDVPPDTSTAPTPAPVPADPVVEGDAEQKVEVAVGASATMTFNIRNDGGSPAEVEVGVLDTEDYLGLGAGTCGGPLDPSATCSVLVTFDPAEPGTYTANLVVRDASTGEELGLFATGVAELVDLEPLFDGDPLRTEGCPGGSPACVDFSVRNLGPLPSPAAVAEVSSEEFVVRVDIPSIEPGGELSLVADADPACQDIGCDADVVIDPDDALAESDEDNNTDDYSAVD